MEITLEDLIPKFDFVGHEKDVERHIIDNIEDICLYCNWGRPIEVERQFSMRDNNVRIRFDILIWHEDNTVTLIEVKKSKTNRNDIIGAIGQVLFYGKIFKEKYKVLPRLVVASPAIHMETYDTIREFSLPISTLMVDGDRCVYLT